MLSNESKEAAISDILEIINKFNSSLHKHSLYDEITGGNSTPSNSNQLRNNDLNAHSEDEDYDFRTNNVLNTSEIISKFKNQVKQYEKQNEYLKNKLDSVQKMHQPMQSKTYYDDVG